MTATQIIIGLIGILIFAAGFACGTLNAASASQANDNDDYMGVGS